MSSSTGSLLGAKHGTHQTKPHHFSAADVKALAALAAKCSDYNCFAGGMTTMGFTLPAYMTPSVGPIGGLGK